MADVTMGFGSGATAKRFKEMPDGSFAEVHSSTAIPIAVTATIASGQSLSVAIDLGDKVLCRITMPAAWTAAGLSFQISEDGETWADLYADGAELTLTVAAGKAYRLAFQDWFGVRFLKVRSGTSSVPVNQAAGRSIILTALAY